jgi:hypothetical protein
MQDTGNQLFTENVLEEVNDRPDLATLAWK